MRQMKGLMSQSVSLGFAFVMAMAAVALQPWAASAQNQSASPAHTIVQIVNDEPISTYDIEARMRLVITTAGQAVSAEALGRIRHQVIETLIDERVQLQEAKRLGIKVEDAEIQNAVATIEKTNRMEPGGLLSKLTQAGVDVGTLVGQIRATLAWRKVVGSRANKATAVTEADIDQYLKDLKQKGGSEYLLAEIFVAAPRARDLPIARATADDLVQQLRKGAQFSALASQFSQAPTAGVGGDMGWVEGDQLDPRLAAALNGLPVGQIAPPIELDDGIVILALRDRRVFVEGGQKETLYDIRRLYVPFDPKAATPVKLAVLQKVKDADAQVKTCDDIAPVAEKLGAQSNNMGEMRLNGLPAPLRPYIEPLNAGEKTKVLPLVDGVMLMMVCNKRVQAEGLPDRNQVRQTLTNRRIDAEARQLLRSLRQNAMIETPDRG